VLTVTASGKKDCLSNLPLETGKPKKKISFFISVLFGTFWEKRFLEAPTLCPGVSGSGKSILF
jgi:hypothetical protein